MRRQFKGKPENYDEKLLWYARAPRAAVKPLCTIEKGNLVEGFGGTLRGNIVSLKGEHYRKPTRAEAIDLARRFRQSCIDEAITKGLLKA